MIKSFLLSSLDFGGDQDFREYRAIVLDLSPFQEFFSGTKLAGIIGVNLLDQFTIRLDFSRKTLTLYLKTHPPISISGATAIPLVDQKSEHRYFAQVSPAQGLNAALLLDTGSVETSLPLV